MYAWLVINYRLKNWMEWIEVKLFLRVCVCVCVAGMKEYLLQAALWLLDTSTTSI